MSYQSYDHSIQVNAPGGTVNYTVHLPADTSSGKIEYDPGSAVAQFSGRRRELRTIKRDLRRRPRLAWHHRRPRVAWEPGTRVVVLDGLAGSGKTTLMSEAAHRLRRRFDGVVKVNLGGSTDAPPTGAEVLRQLSRRLAVTTPDDPDEESLRRRYAAAIGNYRILLLLDDAASAAQVEPVVSFAGASAVLITSRNEITGLPASDSVNVRSFEVREALAQLRAEVGDERVDAERSAAVGIVRKCGCLPLAIHLVAGRLSGASRGGVTLAEIDADLATGGLGAIAPRRAPAGAPGALATIFDGVYRRLPPELGTLFRLLGADARTVDAATAAALVNTDEGPAAEMLRDLHAAHLVEPTGDDPPRYRLHDLLRDFARDRATPDEAAAAARRLSGLRLQMVEAILSANDFRTARATAILAEDEAVRAAERGEPESCLRLVIALAQLYDFIGFPGNWRTLHGLGVAAAGQAQDWDCKIALQDAQGSFLAHQWRWTELIDLVAGAEDTDALLWFSLALARADRPAEAVTAAQRALALAATTAAKCRALRRLGDAHRRCGDLTLGVEFLKTAVEIAEPAPAERSRSLSALATAWESERPGEYAAPAAEALEAALRIDVDGGDLRHEFRTRIRLAALHRRRANGGPEARTQLERAMALAHSNADVLRPPAADVADSLLVAARVFLSLGMRPEAALLLRWVDSAAIPALATDGLIVEGELAVAVGAPARAVAILEEAFDRPEGSADERFRAAMLLGSVYGRLGDYEAAVGCYDYLGEAGIGDSSVESARREADAAGEGSPVARARIGRRIDWRWPGWLLGGLAFLTALLAVNLYTHDNGSLRVTPADGFMPLAALSVTAALVRPLRGFACGVLLGFVAPTPIAYGVILLTSDQARSRGTAGMIVGYVWLVAVAALVTARRGRAPWLLLVMATMVGVGAVSALHQWTSAPVPPTVWDAVGAALIVLGAAWLPGAVRRHPGAYVQRQRIVLIVVPILAVLSAALLAGGLGRQTATFWPGSSGPDPRLALLGLGIAAAGAVAGLTGPRRLSDGLLAGLSFFWILIAVLLGVNHTEPPSPKIWQVTRFGPWLGATSPTTWLLPLAFLAIWVACGYVVLRLTPATGPVANLNLRSHPLAPKTKALVRAARWRRGRGLLAYACAMASAALLASYLAELAHPPVPDGDLTSAVLSVAFFAGLAGLVHPGVSVRHLLTHSWLRWVVTGLLVAGGLVAAVEAVLLAADSWSRTILLAASLSALSFSLAGLALPLRRDSSTSAVFGWAAAISGCAVLLSTASIGQIVRSLVAAVVVGGTAYLYLWLRDRRTRGRE